MEVCVCFCYNKMRATIKNYENSNTIKTREGKNMETMQGKKNIVLIGMPGAGKSTVGVVLAKRLGYRFLDSDLVIQQREGMTLERIIEKHGDAGFIQIENEVNCSISPHHTVIATGGSAVYGKEAMEHFKDIGTVVYLELPPESLEERLGSLKERGVVSNGKTTVEEIYADRAALYKKYADITLNEQGKQIRETVEMLYDIIMNKDQYN